MTFIPPMLSSRLRDERLVADPSYVAEPKIDGQRAQIRFPDGRRERTRLLGIDAPEAHECEKLGRDVAQTGRDRAVLLTQGQRASVFARQLLPEGTTLEVEQDLRARMGFVRTGERTLPDDPNQTREYRYERSV